MFRSDGTPTGGSWHISDMFAKQDPVTAVSTSPLAQKINAIDSGISSLAVEIKDTLHLLSQARAANVDMRATLAMQQDLDMLERMVSSLTKQISAIRAQHASLIGMQPLEPSMGMGGGNDPMMASMMQQPPSLPPQMQQAQQQEGM
jgi:hypothetical protein